MKLNISFSLEIIFAKIYGYLHTNLSHILSKMNLICCLCVCQLVHLFTLKSKVRYFVGNPQTAGYGITLTEAGTVIYFSNGYDLEKRLQSEDRAHRIGQKKSVTYVDLIAPKTVDEKIVKALRNKIDIASQVMGEELKQWI